MDWQVLNLGFIKIWINSLKDKNFTLKILKSDNLRIDDIKNFFLLFSELIYPNIDKSNSIPDKQSNPIIFNWKIISNITTYFK